VNVINVNMTMVTKNNNILVRDYIVYIQIYYYLNILLFYSRRLDPRVNAFNIFIHLNV
jgi:hypothetical protein